MICHTKTVLGNDRLIASHLAKPYMKSRNMQLPEMSMNPEGKEGRQILPFPCFLPAALHIMFIAAVGRAVAIAVGSQG